MSPRAPHGPEPIGTILARTLPAIVATSKPRVRFRLDLEAGPGVDGVRALRRFLKAAWRCYGLRCVAVVELAHEHPQEPRR